MCPKVSGLSLLLQHERKHKWLDYFYALNNGKCTEGLQFINRYDSKSHTQKSLVAKIIIVIETFKVIIEQEKKSISTF